MQLSGFKASCSLQQRIDVADLNKQKLLLILHCCFDKDTGKSSLNQATASSVVVFQKTLNLEKLFFQLQKPISAQQYFRRFAVNLNYLNYMSRV